MANNEILTERRGQTLILTFNRPDHANAMTMDMASQLFTHLKNATTDRSVRAILLRGSGGNFMNGIDMRYYSTDLSAALDKANQLILPYHSAVREIQTMDKPVIAAVEGFVTGTGFSLMLAADMVISSQSARFNTLFAKYGLTPDGGCSYFLTRKVGMSRAAEILMLCEDVTPERAKRLHLVNRIVEDERLQEESLAYLDRMAQGPTKAYGAIKKLVASAFDKNLNDQLGLEHTYFGASSRSFDFREAVKAHVAGREPKFTGT
jgi:2-(1,2-epoxy-1,2-dihydrophenyl)acetyl-CoA isomerase